MKLASMRPAVAALEIREDLGGWDHSGAAAAGEDHHPGPPGGKADLLAVEARKLDRADPLGGTAVRVAGALPHDDGDNDKQDHCKGCRHQFPGDPPALWRLGTRLWNRLLRPLAACRDSREQLLHDRLRLGRSGNGELELALARL